MLAPQAKEIKYLEAKTENGISKIRNDAPKK